MLIALLYVQIRLRVHQWWRLSAIKIHIRLDYMGIRKWPLNRRPCLLVGETVICKMSFEKVEIQEKYMLWKTEILHFTNKIVQVNPYLDF